MYLPSSGRPSILAAIDNTNPANDANPTRLVIDDTNVRFNASRGALQATALSRAVQKLVEDAKTSSFNHTLAVITEPVSFQYSFVGYSRIAVYGVLIPASSSSSPAVTAWADYSLNGRSVAVHIPPSAAVATDYPLFTSAELDSNEQYTLAAEIWASPDSPYLFDYLLAFSPKAPAYQRNNWPASSSQATNSTLNPASIITSNSLPSISTSFFSVSPTSILIPTSISTPASSSTSTPVLGSRTQPFPPWAIAAIIIVGAVTVLGLAGMIYQSRRRSERLQECPSPPAQELVLATRPRGGSGPADRAAIHSQRPVHFPFAPTSYQVGAPAYMVVAAYPVCIPTQAGIISAVAWQPLQYYRGPWRSG